MAGTGGSTCTPGFAPNRLCPYNTTPLMPFSVIGYRLSVKKTRIISKFKLIAIAKGFFRLIIVFVGVQRAVPSDHRRARQAVRLQNEITFGNRYNFEL